AERPETDAAALDFAGRSPPGVRHDCVRPANPLARAVTIRCPDDCRHGCAAADVVIPERESSMNPLSANFQELYQRHLCRHSQYGINVIHLATVLGTYLALFAIVHQLSGSWWLLLAIPVPYLAVVMPNLPLRVSVVVIAFLGLFFALYFAVPELPIWLCLVLI